MFKYIAVGKILTKHRAQVDNFLFHLHYRVTFLVFIIASGLVTAKTLYLSKPIQCIAKGIKGNVLNTYCFFMSTFTLPKLWHVDPNEELDGLVVYPGVGPMSPNDEKVYHYYYQWVPLVLFLQALMFYIPRYLWKNMDGGLFTTILGGLETFSLDNEIRMKKYKILTNYMVTHINTHRNWAIRFFLCEALNLVVVVGNIYFTDLFLGGTFLTYGTEVFKIPDMDQSLRTDPMTKIFPRITKCIFRKYGPSGTVETHDTMCIMPVNIINEKVYIFLWFWLIGLTILTMLWLIYRILIITSSRLRGRLLKFRGRWAPDSSIDLISKKCNLGDWFLLYHLGRNMEPCVYGEFLKEFARELEHMASTLERKPMLQS